MLVPATVTLIVAGGSAVKAYQRRDFNPHTVIAIMAYGLFFGLPTLCISYCLTQMLHSTRQQTVQSEYDIDRFTWEMDSKGAGEYFFRKKGGTCMRSTRHGTVRMIRKGERSHAIVYTVKIIHHYFLPALLRVGERPDETSKEDPPRYEFEISDDVIPTRFHTFP